MAKPHVTRTLAPIHFEDLDPHRFEDLVRQLIYDFRFWKSIESTGRGGADDGFDVRAYEHLEQRDERIPSEDEQEELPHPMEGNLWMIQCKREKAVGPKKIAQIIDDGVDPENPPYGYILAAPVHFSKAAHDRFRHELRGRGVMEFFLWGAGELEDMLYQPKNDRILFAFFGISLTTRRRSRTTEIRAIVSVKNKLMRTLGDNPDGAVLLRDLADEHYPYEAEVADFDKRPSWKQYDVVELIPEGVVVLEREEFAYFDQDRNLWDATPAINLAPAGYPWGERKEEDEAARLAVKGYWELLPRRNRAKLITHGLVRFDSIALVDDRGDSKFSCPHIFLEFDAKRGGLSGRRSFLELNPNRREEIDDLTRTEIFPKEFPRPAFGTIHRDKVLSVDEQTRSSMRYLNGGITVHSEENAHNFLKPCDVISIDATDRDEKQVLVKITNIRPCKGAEIISRYDQDPMLRHQVERQLGREVKPRDRLEVVEASTVYDWQIEQDRPVI